MSAGLRWAGLLAAFIAALSVPLALGLTPDVSWLLTVAERMLDGEILYRDILEYNPPFSVWLYTAPALLSRATGLPSEFFLYAQFCFIFAVAFIASSAVLVRADCLERRHIPLSLGLWIVLFVLFPLRTFLQREHLAMMILMPWLAMQVARWNGAGGFKPAPWMIAIGALSCATIVMTKPFYVLTILFPVAALAWRTRSVRPFFHLENFLGGLVAIAYGAAVLQYFPDYLGSLYTTLEITYLPVRTPAATMFFMVCAATILAALLLLAMPARWPALTVVPVLAACGHMAGLLVMGKAFTYHALPALIMLLLAGAALIADAFRGGCSRERPGRFRLLRRSAAGLLAGLTIVLVATVFLRGESVDSALLSYLRENHRGETFVTVSPSFSDSHPLVRLAGGRYLAPHGAMLVESYGSILIAQNPDMPQAERAAIFDEYAKERRIYAETILDKLPDVVLVSDLVTRGGNPAWTVIAGTARDGITIADLYERETSIGGVTILRRISDTGSLPRP